MRKLIKKISLVIKFNKNKIKIRCVKDGVFDGVKTTEKHKRNRVGSMLN